MFRIGKFVLLLCLFSVPLSAQTRTVRVISTIDVGTFGDPALLVDLAVAAEEHGWDGFFVWDHQLYWDPRWAVADPVVVIAAVHDVVASSSLVTVAVPAAMLTLLRTARSAWRGAGAPARDADKGTRDRGGPALRRSCRVARLAHRRLRY